MPKPPQQVSKRLAERRFDRRLKENHRSDARYAEILRTAAAQFKKRGFLNTSLKDIADAMEIDRASLYYYVSTKEELLIELLTVPLFEMTRKLRDIAACDLPASERMRQAVIAQMDAYAESPELFTYFALRLHTKAPRPGDLARNTREYADLMTSIIESGQRSGEFRCDITARTAMLGINGMCNWTHRWYRPDGRQTLHEIGVEFAEIAVGGLLAPAAGHGLDGHPRV
jgi:TetR/AcrR family transcriptional regulator, cholesterol catabolism regulator